MKKERARVKSISRDVIVSALSLSRARARARVHLAHAYTSMAVHASVCARVAQAATVCPSAAALGRLARVSHQQLMAGATQLAVTGAFA